MLFSLKSKYCFDGEDNEQAVRCMWMQGDAVEAGDLLVFMEEGDEPANPLKVPPGTLPLGSDYDFTVYISDRVDFVLK